MEQQLSDVHQVMKILRAKSAQETDSVICDTEEELLNTIIQAVEQKLTIQFKQKLTIQFKQHLRDYHGTE